ncbi:MAG: hypothetical protein J6U64_03390 [Alphaproteobacteria bacterium]|nr:hypothetical protein [Alphaproteobacteria bacterium]
MSEEKLDRGQIEKAVRDLREGIAKAKATGQKTVPVAYTTELIDEVMSAARKMQEIENAREKQN